MSKNHWKSADYVKTKGPPEINYLYGTRPKRLDSMVEIINKTFTFNGFDKDSKILEIGCNLGANLRYMSQTFGCNVTGFDINEEVINKCKTHFGDKGHFYVADVREKDLLSKYKDNEFDLGFSTAVLTHILPEEKKSLIKEFLRVCKQVLICESYAKNPQVHRYTNEYYLVSEDYRNYSEKLIMYPLQVWKGYTIYYKK